MKSCSKCMAENADDAKFCKLCSAALQPGGGKICPSGRHTMDPMWSECAYCKADAGSGAGRSMGAPPPPLAGPPPLPALPPRPMAPQTPAGPRKETVIEGNSTSDAPAAPMRAPLRAPTQREDAPLPPRPAPRSFPGGPPPAGSPGLRATPVAASAPARGHTVFGPAVSSTPPSVSKGRKIVGVLVTYSWRPEGKVYEVREGRNLIGRDQTCDICIPEDETMSGVNSHITYRSSFVIGDMVSMMGTDVNGVAIEEQFKRLPDHAVVRSGSTHFTFIAVNRTNEAQSVEE